MISMTFKELNTFHILRDWSLKNVVYEGSLKFLLSFIKFSLHCKDILSVIKIWKIWEFLSTFILHDKNNLSNEEELLDWDNFSVLQQQ